MNIQNMNMQSTIDDEVRSVVARLGNITQKIVNGEKICPNTMKLISWCCTSLCWIYNHVEEYKENET